jgi:hypothetical protein
MYGDFSRNPNRCRRRYTGVLMQQGRPLTDADWNEQASIWESRYRDVLGWLLGTKPGTLDGGFKLDGTVQDPSLSCGSYVVDGILCQWRRAAALDPVLAARLDEAWKAVESAAADIRLIAWEQTVNPLMDAALLEPALLNNDTAWRSRVAWQIVLCAREAPPESQVVRNRSNNSLASWNSAAGARVVNAVNEPNRAAVPCECGDPTSESEAPPPGALCADLRRLRPLRVARTAGSSMASGACDAPSVPASSDSERLYRIEIHRRGKPINLDVPGSHGDDLPMTFKWARDNGSTIRAVGNVTDGAADFDASGFAAKSPIDPRDHVEFRDQWGMPAKFDGRLPEVRCVTHEQLQFALCPRIVNQKPARRQSPVLSWHDEAKSPNEPTRLHVQAWHHRGKYAAFPEVESGMIEAAMAVGEWPIAEDGGAYGVVGKKLWIPLGDGLTIQFCANDTYEAGDYWLVRTTDFDANGLIDIACSEDALNDGCVPLVGRRHEVKIGELTTEGGVSSAGWRDCRINKECADETNVETATPDCPAPAPPVSPNPPKPLPEAEPAPEVATSVLSPAGAAALVRYFGAARDITRHIPARYLNHEPGSAVYRRFRAALLVSDILEPTLDEYLAKVERCLTVTDDNRQAIVRDAERDYRLAADLRRISRTASGASV